MPSETRDITRDITVHLGYRKTGDEYFAVVEVENSEGTLTHRFVGKAGYPAPDHAIAVGAEIYSAVVEFTRSLGYHVTELSGN